MIEGSFAKRMAVAVCLGLLAAVPGLPPVSRAVAAEVPQIVWKSEERLWWNTPWLDWDVANGNTARCSLDGRAPFECPIPWKANEALQASFEGMHELTVTPINDQVDPAVEGEPVTVQVGIDRTDPTASLTREESRRRLGPGEPTTVHGSYGDDLSGIDHVTCKLDPMRNDIEGYIPCEEDLADGVETYTLPEGGYEMYLAAYDRAGNSHGSGYVVWYVDDTPPTAWIERVRPKLILGPRSPRLQLQGSEGGPSAMYESSFTMRARIGVRQSGPERVRWRYPDGWVASGTGEIPTYTRRIRKMVPGRTYCAEVASVDEVGNRQSWTSRRCFVRAQDDRDFRTSAGWRSTSPRGAYRATALTSTTRGSRVHVRGEGVRELMVRALRCGRCGAVVVRAGGREVGRWNLRGYSRRWRVKRFRLGGAYTGRITVRSLGSRRVVLDAWGLRALR